MFSASSNGSHASGRVSDLEAKTKEYPDRLNLSESQHPEQRDLFGEMVTQDQHKKGTIWRLDDVGQLEAIQVILGSSDASHTEIIGQGIEEGMKVICGIG
jgi:hypothetical protein